MPRLPDYKLVDRNSGKRLYGRGWLGLIPMFGAFVGIWLLIMGIFRYKDKKLIFIGIGGILFTVLVYGSSIYYSFYTDAGRKEFTGLAKMSMNSLVANIEFYKVRNGKYPDSLEQLRTGKQNEMIFLSDPISARKSINFYYEKMDSGYKLFSCGLDMLPNTLDDIYPDIDTKNTGLKKRDKN